MKKLAWLLAVAMLAGCLGACSDDGGTTTPGSGSKPGSKTSEQSGTPAKTTNRPAQTTREKTEPSSAETTRDPNLPVPSYPEEFVIDIPGGKAGDTQLKGYPASGDFITDDGKLNSDMNHSLLVVTNDRMSAGKLTATFTSAAGSTENDNGIVFGMEENTSDDAYYFWEETNYAAPYYMLFVSDNKTLYLARVACNGEAWHELAQSQAIIGYDHGGTVTVSVEFDGQGKINCYANGELLIEYQDDAGPRGSRYGVRCEAMGVVYDSLIAEHAEE